MSLIKELKRRNVFRVAVAYGVVAWLLIQVGATLEPAMHLPEWTDSILAFFLLLGFPIAMFFAWAYELTPDGLKRDGDIAPDAGERAVASQKWDRLIILLLVLALGYFAVDKYFITESAIESAGLNPDAAETDALTGVSSKSIAVLPFVNMSSDPEQEYFSDGLTEELLNLLAGIDDLKVAARTSSFFYKNKVEDIPMREIAQQLEVAHILEGSVRRDGNQIRITAQLIKADDGFHLWSETYDRTLDSIFAIQDEIAAVVVDQLKITLLGELPHAKVVNTESLDLTMEGRYLFNRRQEGDWSHAYENFKRAVELDPENVEAWTWLSPLHGYINEDWDKAQLALEKALELDPDNATALMRKAMYMRAYDRPDEAEYYGQRALEEGPDNPWVLSMAAGRALRVGDLDTALKYDRRAVAFDPLNLNNLRGLADSLIMSGNLDEAEIYLLRAIEIAPDSPVGNGGLANLRLLQGRGEEALEFSQKLPNDFVEFAIGIPRLLNEAMAYHTMGDSTRADEKLKEYTERAGEEVPFDVAQIHAWRGEADEVFEWIDRALDQDPDLEPIWFRSPFWDNIKSDPRYAELMARLEN
jgi:TolB-like protein/Tfp pilus assembly protein PilF